MLGTMQHRNHVMLQEEWNMSRIPTFLLASITFDQLITREVLSRFLGRDSTLLWVGGFDAGLVQRHQKYGKTNSAQMQLYCKTFSLRQVSGTPSTHSFASLILIGERSTGADGVAEVHPSMKEFEQTRLTCEISSTAVQSFRRNRRSSVFALVEGE